MPIRPVRPIRSLLALVAVPALLGLGPAGAAPACSGPPAAFVSVVYDSAARYDFQNDVEHFQAFAWQLRDTYCLPPERTTFLAFDGNFSVGGNPHGPGSEAAVKAAIADVGRAVVAQPDMTVFFMLSSHGNVTTSRPESCHQGRASAGSFAALRGGDGEDGRLYDCELGRALHESIPGGTDTVVIVDCSFCGGFSDSLTAGSGSIPDDAATLPSGVPAPGRIVITGCAMTTECFGSQQGGVLYRYLREVSEGGPVMCDGLSAPGFPALQGANAPLPMNAPDGRCTMSEWFFGAVRSVIDHRDAVGVQEQFRIKYGLESLERDLIVL